MTNSQRRLILIVAVLFALIQFVTGFRAFMEDTEGGNLVSILPVPLATLGIGLFVWFGRNRNGGGPDQRRGRIMKGPWNN